MSEVGHQLLITLVPGTWPRGLFPRLFRFKQRVRELTRRRQPWEPPPFWFEEGSHFLARLSAELHDLPHKITLLPWSGANSIRARDEAAHDLAKYLSAEHAEHPRATQLIIAHSHGGNVALHALHLQERDAPRGYGPDDVNPLVVTLATPFIEIHRADLGERPDLVRTALLAAIGYVLVFLALWLFTSASVAYLAVGVPMGFLGWYWISRRAGARQNKAEALADATRLGEAASTRPLLVIRAIDDEASLVLALGATVNYLTARSLTYALWMLIFFSVIFFVPEIILIRNKSLSLESVDFSERRDWYERVGQLGIAALILALSGLLAVARTVHGKELAVSPLECQINTQSTPDAVGLSKTVTLVGHPFVQSLRHSIYDHEECARVISDWVRSRLVPCL
jgi:hypothetical protein